MRDPGALQEWRSHWTVVLAACIGVAGSSMHSYAVGLFIEPLQTAFGWTRTQISLGPAIAAVAAIFMAPLGGAFADRIGPRRMAIGGMSALCIITGLLGVIGPSIYGWLNAWLGFSFLAAFVLPNIWSIPVAGYFRKGRGLALGVTLAGSGLSSIFTPLLAYWLIEQFGWRMAFVGLGLVWGGLAIPTSLLFLTSPRDEARRSETSRSEISHPGLSIALRSSGILSARFAALALGALFFASVVPPLVINFVPVLTAGGVLRSQAASIAAAIGITAIAGRMTIGLLLDRFTARTLAVVVTMLPLAACLLLITQTGSVSAATVAALLLGLSLGAEYDIVAYMASRYFRIAHFGLIFGTLSGLITFAGSGGPLWVNAIFDATGSYLPALKIAAPLCPAAGILFFLLGTYPETTPEPANAAATMPAPENSS